VVYPQEHILIRFNGWFGGGTYPGSDTWSAGLRMGLVSQAPAYDAAKLQTLVNACHTAAKALHSASGMGTGINCYLNQTTGAQIGVNGKYLPSTQQTIFSPIDPIAGVGTGALPWSTAMVYSLRTANPRGRASNGRVYWPAPSATIDITTGRITAAQVTSRLNAFKTFLNACNTAANTYWTNMKVVVASNVGGGEIQPVTSVRVDQRLDSIERRENNQPAVWQSVTIP
jgi:hypothetical protein